MSNATLTTQTGTDAPFYRNIAWPQAPAELTGRGSWADNPCFYVSCIDGPRTAILAGPYQTHAEALEAVPEVRRVAEKVDPRACWYAFGTCKAPNGWREGTLNKEMGL